MAANRREEWATRNIGLPPAVKKRLEDLRSYPGEPFWHIVSRLLDEHDQHSPAVGAGDAPKPASALQRGLINPIKRLVGKDGQPPEARTESFGEGLPA